jgi:MFS family permease
MTLSTDENDSAGGSPAHDPYAALRIRNFRLYLFGSLIANAGLLMQTTVVGWEVYQRTGSKLNIALIGLVQVIPVILLAIVAGHVADRFRRQFVVAGSIAVVIVGSLGLAIVSFRQAPIEYMYGWLLLIAIGRAFHQPAKSSLLPLIIPREIFSNAVTWGMSGFQLSSVIGPALGGALILVDRKTGNRLFALRGWRIVLCGNDVSIARCSATEKIDRFSDD